MRLGVKDAILFTWYVIVSCGPLIVWGLTPFTVMYAGMLIGVPLWVALQRH